jgi:hypothetical protein
VLFVNSPEFIRRWGESVRGEEKRGIQQFIPCILSSYSLPLTPYVSPLMKNVSPDASLLTIPCGLAHGTARLGVPGLDGSDGGTF